MLLAIINLTNPILKSIHSIIAWLLKTVLFENLQLFSLHLLISFGWTGEEGHCQTCWNANINSSAYLHFCHLRTNRNFPMCRNNDIKINTTLSFPGVYEKSLHLGQKNPQIPNFELFWSSWSFHLANFVSLKPITTVCFSIHLFF